MFNNLAMHFGLRGQTLWSKSVVFCFLYFILITLILLTGKNIINSIMNGAIASRRPIVRQIILTQIRHPWMTGPRHLLHVERGRENDIALDQLLRLLHLGVERWIANQFGRILDLATSFIQPSNRSDNSTLHHISEIGNAVE